MITDYANIIITTEAEGRIVQQLFFDAGVYWGSGKTTRYDRFEILPVCIIYDKDANLLSYGSKIDNGVVFKDVVTDIYKKNEILILPSNNILVFNNNDLYSLTEMLKDKGYWSQGPVISFNNLTRALLVVINEPDKTFRVKLPYVYSMDVVSEGFDVL